MLLVDKKRFRERILSKFNGNYTECANALGVELAHLHKFLTKNSNAGPVLMGALFKFCEKEGLDFKHFIFLGEPSTALDNQPTGTEGGSD